MIKKSSLLFGVAVLFLVFCSACGDSEEAAGGAATVDSAVLQLFAPLPEVMESDTNPISEEKVILGRMLYYEPRLSQSQEISCNSCHLLDKYGVDGEPTSDGHEGQVGDRNSPTVYNAAGHFAQFWDGRAADIEEQAKGPVMNPVEMAMPSEEVVLSVLNSMPGYIKAFEKAFPEDKNPVTYDNMAKAIGAFERKLTTPSRWDKFLQGDETALSSDEKAGFNAYMEAGCQICHAGAYLGGSFFQMLGVAKPWPDTSDLGRYKVTNDEADRMLFKVPSLRNIDQTGPYYHDGKVATLEEAVSAMSEYQLGNTLSDDQLDAIMVWLKALTGEIPLDYIQEPTLPEGTAATPKPNGAG